MGTRGGESEMVGFSPPRPYIGMLSDEYVLKRARW